jgi:hypothetical protein
VLTAAGFSSLQANRKTREGEQHVDRGEQLRSTIRSCVGSCDAERRPILLTRRKRGVSLWFDSRLSATRHTRPKDYCANVGDVLEVYTP